MAQIQVVAELMNDLEKLDRDYDPEQFAEVVTRDRMMRLIHLRFIKRDKKGIVRWTPMGRYFHNLISQSTIVDDTIPTSTN